MALTDKTKLVLDQVLGSTIASREISKATDDSTSAGSTAAADIASLEASRTADEADISALQSDMGTAQSDIGTLQSDMGTAQSDITGLQTSQDVWPHGATGARPVGAVLGQRYFDTDLGKPIWCVGGGNWVFADGTPA